LITDAIPSANWYRQHGGQKDCAFFLLINLDFTRTIFRDLLMLKIGTYIYESIFFRYHEFEDCRKKAMALVKVDNA